MNTIIVLTKTDMGHFDCLSAELGLLLTYRSIISVFVIGYCFGCSEFIPKLNHVAVYSLRKSSFANYLNLVCTTSP